MSFSTPFILRPVATSLLACGLLMAGLVAYAFLPVSSLPSIDLPTIRVQASQPGADPAIMAATVAAPLERRLGEIAGVTEITSTSSLGSSTIAVQFELGRSIDSAARDVQAALNAAATDLPSNLPNLPTFRKVNPAAAPILILALTSDTLPTSALYDAADSVLVQRISQLPGVADVTVAGAEQPAIRVRVDPGVLASMGLGIDAVRTAIVSANTLSPVGTMEGARTAYTIGANDQITQVDDYKALILRTANGDVVRLGAIADVRNSTRNSRAAGWFNGKPSVVLIITKQAGANVIETADRVRGLIPELSRWIPAGIDISVMNDRTTTIRASVEELYRTLAISVVLVMAVVWVFLRRAGATLAAGVTVPLSLAGAFCCMWFAKFSVDILSLMAIIVAVGFVIDDAIVMIENADRHAAMGQPPLQAAIHGARQIGFTVLSISISLIAAFIPLLFMQGVIGRLFGEFAWTMVFAIAASAVVSLTVTPMIIARMRPAKVTRPWLGGRIVDGALNGLARGYLATLRPAMRWPGLMTLVLIGTIVGTVVMFQRLPKGYFPQDDTGLLIAWTEASPEISFPAMRELQTRVNAIIAREPAIAGAASSVGGSGFGSVNNGRLFISLKPLSQRDETSRVIARLRRDLSNIPGMRVFIVQAQDLRIGARQGKSQYQFTLWNADYNELQAWVPRIVEAVRKVPGLVDVSTDQERGGLQTKLSIDRMAAQRMGVEVSDIDAALASAFSQRQISTIYGPRNQYRVILEVEPRFARSPNDISRLYVPGTGRVQVPLSTLVKVETTTAPLVVNHQGPFPAVTITYNLAEGAVLDETMAALRRAVDDLHPPPSLRTEFAGEARDFAQNSSGQAMLIITALLVIYIVLGVLYESLVHPLTILSTLPSAGLGALLALWGFGMELSVIAMIGIILLIGIVKKNGIMLVDFAIEAERERGITPEEAILEACAERFRPILMTTLAAMLGALPLAFGSGPGAALRQPLGITIIGGLVVSQVLTLYTTPALYLLLERLRLRFARRRQAEPVPAPGE
jgi:hydrophobe/amphiphile efflux-1 (HAE1) family protein